MQRTHRPTSHKKDPMKQYQGAVSRAQGKHFEEYIDLSLRYYEQRGEAVVEKTPEPMRPTKDLVNLGAEPRCDAPGVAVGAIVPAAGDRVPCVAAPLNFRLVDVHAGPPSLFPGSAPPARRTAGQRR